MNIRDCISIPGKKVSICIQPLIIHFQWELYSLSVVWNVENSFPKSQSKSKYCCNTGTEALFTLPTRCHPPEVPPIQTTLTGRADRPERVRPASLLPRTGHGTHRLGPLQRGRRPQLAGPAQAAPRVATKLVQATGDVRRQESNRREGVPDRSAQ